MNSSYNKFKTCLSVNTQFTRNQSNEFPCLLQHWSVHTFLSSLHLCNNDFTDCWTKICSTTISPVVTYNMFFVIRSRTLNMYIKFLRFIFGICSSVTYLMMFGMQCAFIMNYERKYHWERNSYVHCTYVCRFIKI